MAWAAPAAAAKSGPAATKPASYKIVSADFTAASGLDTAGSVTCPKVKGVQTVPLSGGALIDGNSLQTSINSSWPTATGWHARVNNASAAATGFSVYAVCAKKLTGYVQQESAAVSNPANTQNGAGYECPAADVLLGGGAESTSHSTLVNLDSSWPAGTSIWYVYLNNASTAHASFHVYHVCAKLNVTATSYQLVAGTPVVNAAGTQSGASVFCPDALATIGGGLVSSSTSIDVTLNTTFPFAGGWGGDENNNSGASNNLTAYVLCAS
ncbi:MAG TPA: hypothetical protein VGH27_05120 [Streptosporangiaceae bacterium]